MEDTMTNRLTVSLVAATLLASSAAFAQSTTVEGARGGAAAGGSVAGPVGEAVGGTVGAAVGLGLETPECGHHSDPGWAPPVGPLPRALWGRRAAAIKRGPANGPEPYRVSL